MEGNSASSEPTCSLQKDGSSPERVSGSTRWFKNCFPGIHSLPSHVERKYGIDKTHAPRSLNRKSMDGGGRTTNEHSFPWEEASPGKETMEYLLTPSPPPPAIGEDIGTIPRLSNLFPVGSRDCNGHILGFRPGRREDSGTRVLVCPICGISTLNQDMSLEK